MLHTVATAHEYRVARVIGQRLQLLYNRNSRKDVPTRAASGNKDTKTIIL